MRRQLKRVYTEQSGQDLIEYALIVGLLALAVVLAIKAPWKDDPTQTQGLGNSFDHVSTQLGS
ncbi:MAG: hypothetical protein U0Q11_26650 [Vicinamibacterales bacterium]